jgi:hypothetical protein
MRLPHFRILPDDEQIGWTPLAWLIYFPALFMWPILAHADAAVWAATVLGGALFLPLYFRGFWCLDAREKYWIIASIAVIGLVLTPVNPGAPVLTVYAASFAGNLRPSRRATLAILLIIAAALFEAIVL